MQFPGNEDVLLALYWKARKATLKHCTELCVQTLNSLAEFGFVNLFQKADSLQGALSRPFIVTATTVRQLLLRGRNRTDVGKKIIPELGYSLALWSPDHYMFSSLCGAYSKWITNNVLLSVSPQVMRQRQAKARLVKLFHRMVTIWQPEQGVLCNGCDLQWEGDRLAHFPSICRYTQS